MKKLLITLLVLPVLMTACIEDLLDVTFDYPLETEFLLTDAITADTPFVIESETVEVTVVQEMADRNLGSIASVKLKSLEVTLSEDATIDWSVLKSAEIKMILDGEEFSMAVLGENTVADGATLNLQVNADELLLEEFLARQTVQVQLEIETNVDITTEVPMSAKAVIAITASPVE